MKTPINLFFLFPIVCMMCFCNSATQSNEEHKVLKEATIHTVEYDCLLGDFFAKAAWNTHKFETNLVKSAGTEVTDKEENDYGEEVFKEIKKEYRFLENQELINLEKILNTLLSARPERHKSLEYRVFLLDDEAINAFTAGGYIFVYKGLVDYCSNNHELAFIIAHEIAHNELNHLNLILRRIKTAGAFGEVLYVVKQITSASFNQFDELEADCYAIDLLMATSYDPVQGIKFWKKLSEESKEKPSKFQKFFMTHPYSSERYDCSVKHLKKHYNIDV